MARPLRRLVLLITLMLGVSLVLPTSAEAKNKVHVVQKGHSLWSIARRYGVSVKAIRDLNGLKKGKPIRPGQKLEIPPKGSKGSKKKSKDKDDKKESKKKSKSKDEDDKKKDKTPWWKEKPPRVTQTQKSSKERGVNPCNSPDPGYGVYEKWDRGVSVGQMIMPQRGGITRSGRFDVMIHFHGHEPVRKEWVKVMNGPVLVGIDLGIGSGAYERTFRSPAAFNALIESIEKRVAEKTGKKNARVRKLGLSAWSAGYGAVESILRNEKYGKQVDVVILLDGLHASMDEAVMERQLDPFVKFARRATRRQKFMFLSHSAIIPPGYKSTWETTSYLIHELGGKPRKSKRRDPMGLDLVRRYTRGNFHVRGYIGNDKMDHCAHIGLLKDVLKVHVKRRWNSPRGRKGKRKK